MFTPQLAIEVGDVIAILLCIVIAIIIFLAALGWVKKKKFIHLR